MSIYQDPIKLIKCEFLSCWLDCKKAYQSALKNDALSQSSAQAYALSASCHLSCIKSVYSCNYNITENDMVESLIHQFDVFCNELITNSCTEHSHQWTCIEFNKLEELVSSSGIIEL